jgi:putative oxidoreductase
MSDASAIAIALLVLRATIGAVMLAHGWNHVWGGGKIEGTAGWFESLGMRPGRLHAWLASLTELGAGTLLIVGLLTPLAAAGVVGTMTVAWITNHRGNGFFVFRPGEGWEYVMTLTLASFSLATLGGGAWSLDRALGIRDDLVGVPGLLLGLGGAVLAGVLLAVYWRPDPEGS